GRVPAFLDVLGETLVEERRRLEPLVEVRERVDDVDVADRRRQVQERVRAEVEDRDVVRLLERGPREALVLELVRESDRDLVRREVSLVEALARLGDEHLELAV